MGFLANAARFSAAAARGDVLAPAKSIAQMQQVVFNQYLDAGLCALFMLVVLAVLVFGIRACLQAYALSHPSARESAYEPMPEGAN